MLDPVGFWSYTRDNDQHSDRKLSQLRAIVGEAIALQCGTDVSLSQDISAIPFCAFRRRMIAPGCDDLIFPVHYVSFEYVQPGDSLFWENLAVLRPHANAQYNISLLYENGRGVNQDYLQALSWYRKSADQGDEDAKAALKRLSPCAPVSPAGTGAEIK